MSAGNASFEKLLEYQQLARGFDPSSGEGERGAAGTAGVIFRLGENRLTCSVEHIHEFLPLPAFTPVPGTKPWLLGLASLRGELVTIVDLAWFLGGERSRITLRSRLLSATLRGRPIGLLVDEVLGQRHFMVGESSAAHVPEKSPLRGFVKRQYRSGKDTWLELDLDVLFNTAGFLDGAAD